MRHIDHQRRLEVAATVVVRLAAGEHSGATTNRVLDVLAHLGGSLGVDQRADIGTLGQAIADPELGHRRLEFFGEGLVHAVLHVDAVDAHAGLPGVAVLGLHRALDRLVEVGVVEDDERRVTAQLQGHLLDAGRALGHQLGAHFGGAGEGDLAYRRVAREFVTDITGRAGDHAEHAPGNPGTLGQRGQRQCGKRCLRSRLEHHGATGRQRRAGLAGDHRRGEVPRRDCRSHADRLLDHDDALVGLVPGDGVAVHPLGLFGEPLDEGRRVGDFTLGFGQRLALLERHQAGQVVLVLHDQLEPAAQRLRALLGGQIAPGRQRTFGRLDGTTGLGRAHLRHAAKDLVAGRVVHLDGLAAVGILPGAVDIGLLAKQRGIVELHGSLLMGGISGPLENEPRLVRRSSEPPGQPPVPASQERTMLGPLSAERQVHRAGHGHAIARADLHGSVTACHKPL